MYPLQMRLRGGVHKLTGSGELFLAQADLAGYNPPHGELAPVQTGGF